MSQTLQNTPEALAEHLVQTFKPENQDLILIEEMSELTKELIKHRRGYHNREHIVEEYTHVQTSLLVIRSILGIADEEIRHEVKRTFDKVDKLKG